MVWVIFWFFLNTQGAQWQAHIPKDCSCNPYTSSARCSAQLVTPSSDVWRQSTVEADFFFNVAGEAFLTNKVIFSLPCWNFIIDCVTFIKMEHLECVKQEIPEVLIHVDSQDAPVKAVDCTPTIHDLEISDINVTALSFGAENAV